ncbi:hypothetical protein R1flu_021395 [Riccia fluitans]|uniref:Uncharacterized protein n=1 Tax=Riccia fluitans TaxID=41844 RepID=A0ABD1ZP82_9MARC
MSLCVRYTPRTAAHRPLLDPTAVSARNFDTWIVFPAGTFRHPVNVPPESNDGGHLRQLSAVEFPAEEVEFDPMPKRAIESFGIPERSQIEKEKRRVTRQQNKSSACRAEKGKIESKARAEQSSGAEHNSYRLSKVGKTQRNQQLDTRNNSSDKKLDKTDRAIELGAKSGKVNRFVNFKSLENKSKGERRNVGILQTCVEDRAGAFRGTKCFKVISVQQKAYVKPFEEN